MSETNYYQAAVFDLDDTLYPRADYIAGGYAAVSRYIQAVYGFDPLPAFTASGLDSDWEESLISCIMQKFSQFDRSLATRIRHVFLTHIPELRLFRNAQIVLACLRKMNIRICAIAPGPAHAQRMKTRSLGLMELCDAVIYPEDLVGPDTAADSLMLISMAVETPLKRMILTGNMGLTDFSPFDNFPITMLGLKHSSKRKESENMAARNRLTKIKSLLDVTSIIQSDHLIYQHGKDHLHE